MLFGYIGHSAAITNRLTSNELFSKLIECPTVNELVGQVDTKHRTMVGVVATSMSSLSRWSNSELASGLQPIFEASANMDKSGAPPSTAWIRARYAFAPRVLRDETASAYSARFGQLLVRARLNTIWLDRFLFDPPDIDRGKAFYPFGDYEFGNVSWMDPVEIDQDWVDLFPVRAKVAPPTDLGEFFYYEAHFPRRKLDLTPPHVTYQEL